MNPFASIWEDVPQPVVEKPKALPPKVKPKELHTEARLIYAKFLEKKEFLRPHQEYALRVAKATDGPSLTPVMPLATMGTKGGPLLCDHCRKAIILESHPYYGVAADVAWAKNPQRGPKWMSYIKGGLLVRIVENGTLRIYHGYDGVLKHCCTIAKVEMDAKDAAFTPDLSKANLIYRFLRDEFADATQQELDAKLSDIMCVLYSFDPGVGINIPE